MHPAVPPPLKGRELFRTSNSVGQGISSSTLSVHQQLFGFKPSKVVFTNKQRGKAKCAAGRRKKPGRSTWKKDCVCLRDSQHTWKPSPEEKMELAKVGLDLREGIFNTTGNADHIHHVILQNIRCWTPLGATRCFVLEKILGM